MTAIHSDGSIDQSFGDQGVQERVLGAYDTWVDVPGGVYGGVKKGNELVLGAEMSFTCPGPHFRCNQYEKYPALFYTSFDSQEEKKIYKNVKVHEVNQFEVRAGALDSRGRLLLFGHNVMYGTNDFFLTRLKGRGVADKSFNNNGLYDFFPNENAEIGYVVDVLEQLPSRKILLVFFQENRSVHAARFPSRMTILRLFEDGTVDEEFYKDGSLSVLGRKPFAVALDQHHKCLLTATPHFDNRLETEVIVDSHELP